MPSLEIHVKYAKMLGIPEEVGRAVNAFIDNSKHHDFWGSFITRDVNRYCDFGHYSIIVTYRFKGLEFMRSYYYRVISNYGILGLKAFFQHIILDTLERIMRPKIRSLKSLIESLYGSIKYYYVYFYDEDKVFSHIISEVTNFIHGHLIEVERDISNYGSG